MPIVEDNNEDENKGLYIFGRDVSSIPCFRSSFLYGLSGGVVMGLSYFMMTSKVRMATHVGFGSFFCTTLTYWFYCRYQWSQRKFSVGQIQSIIKKPIITYEASSDSESSK